MNSVTILRGAPTAAADQRVSGGPKHLATLLRLYGIPRADVDYIMDTFPIVRRNDEQKYGDYRTKILILEIYDELQRAIDTGKPFVSRLDPPPGDRAASIDSR